MRSILFRMLYGKEEYIDNIILTDLQSKDNTRKIMENLQKDYLGITYLKWKDCKALIDNVNEK